MDLAPTDEQAALIEELHRVAERVLRPAARACEDAGEVAATVRATLAGMGIAVPVSEAWGGQGAFDAVTGIMVAEELAWGDPGIAYALTSAGAAAAVIEQVGTPAQKEELLPGLASGSASAALALAERDAGSDIFRLETSVTPVAGGGLLAGTKYAVAGAVTASVLLVVAGGDGGPTVWRLPPGAPVALTAEDKLGLRGAPTSRLRLDGVPVGPGDRMGDPAAGSLPGVKALLAAKLLGAGIAIGLARAAVDYASAYARERTAFGKPIGAFQGVSFMIADRAIEVDAARLLAWEAGWALEAGSSGASRMVMAACGQAAEVAARASDDAVQVLGGHGYMRDHPAELWYRDAMTLATLDAPWLIGDRFLARAYEPS